jgi:hypothetical protein
MNYLTPEKLKHIHDLKAVEAIGRKYFTTCCRFPDFDAKCKKELRDIGEDYVANHLGDFFIGEA